MPNSNNPLKAGLFIVISFAIACALFFGITGSAFFNGPTKRYTVVFDLAEDVSGLAVGNDVRIGGLKVGSVKAIDVAADRPDGRSVVRATFTVPARYALKTDAAVAVQAGLTGTVNLNIADLGRAMTVATASDELDGLPDRLTSAIASVANAGPELTRTLKDWGPKGSAVLDQVRATAATVDAAVQQVRGKIDPGYEKYAGVADATRGAMANLDDILGDTKGDFRKTMANLSGTTTSINERMPAILDKVAATLDGMRDAVAKVGPVLDEARAVATNAKDAAASVRTLIAANRGRIDEIVKSTTFTAQNLAAASTEIRSAPWRLLYKPSEGEVANQNLYDAARQFAEASRKLQDSAESLRAAAADPATTGETVKAVLDRLDADFADYKKVEATLWERVRK